VSPPILLADQLRVTGSSAMMVFIGPGGAASANLKIILVSAVVTAVTDFLWKTVAKL